MNEGVKALAGAPMGVETWTVEPSAIRDVVLVLDHFRPERHAVTQLYNKYFLGVVYIVDATDWPGCLKLRPQLLDVLTRRARVGTLGSELARDLHSRCSTRCESAYILWPSSCRARITKFHFVDRKLVTN